MKYRGIFLTLLGIIVAILLSHYPSFHNFISSFSTLSYFGAVLIGIFFVSSITVATSVVSLIYLAQLQNPIFVALAAGLGALVGDVLIFRFVRNSLNEELKSLLNIVPYFRHKHILKIFQNKYLAWFLPVAGAIIIASPFPDEVGVSLMGLSKIKPWRFVLLSFILNTAGIYILLTAFNH